VSDDGYAHCPNCLAEYRAGYTICVECGSLLVPGPSPARAPMEPGSIEITTRAVPEPAAVDRFALEETPIVLTSIVEEDADAFLASLEEQGIGARRGIATDDRGVEIVIHEAHLAEAQAVLVEFTGDPELLDEIGSGAGSTEEPELDDLAVVTWTRLSDAGVQANRLRSHGLAVRIEIPAEGAEGQAGQAAILVPADDVARARAILGIAV
jgi:hypothetical protein